ncbi:MAG TPA: hypothetical protein VFK41_05290 [Nocardioidaceae bacterium]|nr:hypothetical protein [Nocardioidaceae bacterium]
MRTEIRNRVTMLKADVVAEVPASSADRRRWLMLRHVGPGDRVALVVAETPVDFDPDEYLSPEDVLAHAESQYADVDEAVAALRADGVDTDTFDAPWKTDCPF